MAICCSLCLMRWASGVWSRENRSVLYHDLRRDDGENFTAAPAYQLESDTVRWSLELSAGESFIHGVRFNNVVVSTLKVVSAPQAGRITLQGRAFCTSLQAIFRDESSCRSSSPRKPQGSWKFCDRN